MEDSEKFLEIRQVFEENADFFIQDIAGNLGFTGEEGPILIFVEHP